ncbi:very long chain fatty acid elongase 4-like isoform X2 [Argopecten irradians]|uniref:very long chain fatty acid elongase 4-like isoform X2 n=1 Tax=Argopecten irradians TaxID=31199 RepID=UPI00371929FC
MEVLQDKYYEFQKFWDWAVSISDPRVKDWPLMQSYTPTIALTILYIFSVIVGKRVMANRDPIKFKYTLFFYNLGLIILNFHISATLFISAYRAGYSLQCQSVKYSYDVNEYNIACALWWFYISKLVEMMDTIFFVLRKKNNQISFLHVYHHASMFPLWFIGVKWVAGGQSFFGAMINSFIHVLMYSYYGLSALGPHMQKYLWWKRYLTILQLIQFVVGIIHAAQSLFFRCDFPEWMHWALCLYAFSILLLFLNFYFHAYIVSLRRQKQSRSSAKGEVNGKSTENGSSSVNGSSVANGHMETKKDK